MPDVKHPRHLDARTQIKPSEAEIMQALEDAMRLYEDSMSLADMPDYLEEATVGEPIYSWENPMGLVVAGKSHAVVE